MILAILLEVVIKELNKNTVVVKEELIARIKFGNDAPVQKTNIENIIKTMQKLESEVAVPMKFKMEISGFLLADEKTNGNMFTKKELEFLTEQIKPYQVRIKPNETDKMTCKIY